MNRVIVNKGIKRCSSLGELSDVLRGETTGNFQISADDYKRMQDELSDARKGMEVLKVASAQKIQELEGQLESERATCAELREEIAAKNEQDETCRARIVELEAVSDELREEIEELKAAIKFKDDQLSDLEVLLLGEFAWFVQDGLCEDLRRCVDQSQEEAVADLSPYYLLKWVSDNPEYVDLRPEEYEALEYLFARIDQCVRPRVQVAHPVILLQDSDVFGRCKAAFLNGLPPICRNMLWRLSPLILGGIDAASIRMAGMSRRHVAFNQHQGRIGVMVCNVVGGRGKPRQQ